MFTTEETNQPGIAKEVKAAKEIPYNRAVIILVTGDVVCFLIFAALGRNTHGEAAGFAAIPQIITTALPFVIGWFLVSPFVGAFRREIVARPGAMALRTALAWLLSWPVAMLLRGVFVDHGVPKLSFALIVLLFNMVLLVAWRWLFALYNRRRKQGVFPTR